MQELAPSPAQEPLRAPAGRRVDLDVLRVAAMAGVVAIHVLSAGLSVTPRSALFPYLALDRLLNAVCVPAFVLLTGMLVWGRREARVDASWWSRRVRVVFVPYIAWSLLYWALALATRPPMALAALPGDLATKLAFGSASYHLYFPPVLLFIYLSTPAARAIARRSPELLFAVSLAGPLLLVAFVRAVPVPAEVVGLLAPLAVLTPFAAAGAWLAVREYDRRVRRLAVPLGIAGVVLLLVQSAGVLTAPPSLDARPELHFATFLATVCALVMTVTLLDTHSDRLRPRAALFAWLAAASYGVYLAHPLVLRGIRDALWSMRSVNLWRSPLFALAAYAAVLALTVALVWLLKSTKWTRWLV